MPTPVTEPGDSRPPIIQSLRPSLWQELRALPAAFWILFWGMFINRLGTFVYPFLTITLGYRGFTNGEIGTALGGYGVGALFASLSGGWFADRFGRRLAIVVGTILNAIAVLALGHANSLLVLCCLTTVAGFSTGFYGPAVQAFVADVVPLELRLRAYAAFRVGLNAGFACGTALGGILVTLAPQWIFWGDALTTLAYGMVAAVFLPVSQRLDSLQASWAAAWQVLRTDRIFWMLAGMEICVSLIWAQFSTTYGRHIMERQLELDFLGWHFTPERVFGLLIGWNGTLVMLLELGASRFTQRFPLRSSMVIGLLLQGLGFSLNAVPGDVTWMLFAMTIFTLGEIWYSPVHSTYIMQISPEQMRGRYQGALGLGSCLARSVGPWMGFLMLAHSPTLLWLTCGALSVVGVLCLLLARAKTILGARNS